MSEELPEWFTYKENEELIEMLQAVVDQCMPTYLEVEAVLAKADDPYAYFDAVEREELAKLSAHKIVMDKAHADTQAMLNKYLRWRDTYLQSLDDQ